MDIREQIGKRIRELRQAKGLSQEAFALEIGLDRTYIASVENGKRNISIINLKRYGMASTLRPRISLISNGGNHEY